MSLEFPSLLLCSAADSEGGGASGAPFTPNKNEYTANSCDCHPLSNNLNMEGVDSQQGTLESTDGHYTASAFASRGKFSQTQALTIPWFFAQPTSAKCFISNTNPSLKSLKANVPHRERLGQTWAILMRVSSWMSSHFLTSVRSLTRISWKTPLTTRFEREHSRLMNIINWSLQTNRKLRLR